MIQRRSKFSKKVDLRNNALGIIIAVICLVFLIGLVALIYQQFSDEESQKAKKILNLIETKANALEEGEKTLATVQGMPNWGLLGWGKNDEGRPDKCYFKSCICVCPDGEGFAKMSEWSESCHGKGFCRFFDASEIEFSVDKNKFAEYEKVTDITGRESLGILKKDKEEGDFKLIFLRGNLNGIEIFKDKDKLRISDVTEDNPEEKSDEFADMVKSMCFINEGEEIADLDYAAGERDMKAAGITGGVVYEASTEAMKKSVLEAAEVVVKEGTKIDGLSPYLDTLKGAGESGLELKVAAENAVIKHFPEKEIYNIVWDPKSKKVIGQVTSQGYIRHISHDMVKKLGKDISGIFGKTGGSILKKSPSLAPEVELIVKGEERIVKFKDIKIVGSKRTLKMIKDNTALYKTLGKIGGKVLIAWGVFCDSVAIGMTADQLTETIGAVNEAGESVREADQDVGIKIKESIEKKTKLLATYLTILIDKYGLEIEGSANLKEKYDELHNFLKSAEKEANALDLRYERFLNNLDTEGGEGNKDLDFKITELERKELYSQWENLDDQLNSLESEIIKLRDYLAEDIGGFEDMEKMAFVETFSPEYILDQSYSIYSSITPSSSFFNPDADLNEFHRKNYIFENVEGVWKRTDFYFKHVEKEGNWENPLMLGSYEIGIVEGERIVINNGQMLPAIVDLAKGDTSKENLYLAHFKLLKGARIVGGEIYSEKESGEANEAE